MEKKFRQNVYFMTKEYAEEKKVAYFYIQHKFARVINHMKVTLAQKYIQMCAYFLANLTNVNLIDPALLNMSIIIK